MKVSEVPQAATHISMELTAMSKGSRALKHGWSWFVQGFYQNVRGSFVLCRSHKVEHSSPYVVLTGFEGFGAASSTAVRGGCRAHCEEGLKFEVIALSPEDPGTQFPECTKQHFISIYPSRQSRRPSPLQPLLARGLGASSSVVSWADGLGQQSSPRRSKGGCGERGRRDNDVLASGHLRHHQAPDGAPYAPTGKEFKAEGDREHAAYAASRVFLCGCRSSTSGFTHGFLDLACERQHSEKRKQRMPSQTELCRAKRAASAA